MLNLAASNDKIQLVTSSAADIHVHASFVDVNGTTFTPGSQKTAVTSATTTDIVGAPGASTVRNVKSLTLRNKHASTANDVTILVDVSATDYEVFKCTLAAGEELVYRDGVFFHYDSQGGVYGRSLPTATTSVEGGVVLASQGDMETGTASNRAVTPQGVNWHPGVAKCWWRVTVAAGTPTLANSWNITSITDTATCQVTITIATDFSGVNYAITYGFEVNTNTLSATTTSLMSFIRNGTPGAGSFIQQACEIDVGAATDPATWYGACFGDQ